MIQMKDKCVWNYEGAQFAGGPFFLTSCGVCEPDVIHTPKICHNCGREIYYQDDEDE